MAKVLLAGCLVLALAAMAWLWRRARAYRLAAARLAAGAVEESAVRSPEQRADSGNLLSGPWRLAALASAWTVCALLAVILALLLRWPWMIAGASGLIAGLLVWEIDGFLWQRRITRLETQLADAIDLMVGALSAGASVLGAIQAASEETPRPLKAELDDIAARIRLGDDPQAVFRGLSERVPLETYLLFATALGVHWEVGGSLTPTLSTVGRTIRDRLETTRRIASNVVQSQLSTLFILGLTYFIAAVVWRNTPDQMAAFIGTQIGQTAVSGTMLLQAIGIVWMSRISQPKF